MATLSTTKAKDDSFLSSSTGLTEDSQNVVFLDVLANDSGGNSIQLYSLDDSAPVGNNSDLTVKDTARSEAATLDRSAHGAKIWITTDGKVGYDITTADASFKAALQALNVGQFLTDTFTYAVQTGNGNGSISWATVTVQIAGVNDAAVLSAPIVTLAEGNTPAAISTSGVVTITDVDSPATFVVQTGTVGSYGTFTINAAGAWTYTANSAYNEFVAGSTHTDTFSVRSADNTLTTVTINILGTNDAAVITGTSTAEVTETNAVPSPVGGTLSATDVDSPATFVAQASIAGTYGTFSITSAGVWNYTLNGPHNEFAANRDYIDTVNVTTVDGTARALTVTIHGTNDAAVLSADTRNLTETNLAADISASGTLTISDVDSPAQFAPQTTAGTYGTFSINSAGAWTYTASSAHDEFVAGSTHTDVFTVTSADGTTTTVTINILGTNDAAVLSADVRNLTETNTVLSTGGTLTISDVDSLAEFVAQPGTAGTYGTFSITSAGVWTYTASSAHSEFVAGTTYTDIFSVASSDGTMTSVTINIAGIDDVTIAPPILTVTTSTLIDESGIPLLLSGSISAILPVTNPVGTMLSYTISNVPADVNFSQGTNNNNGSWTFSSDQLTGLTFTATPDNAFGVALSVTATATYNGTSTTSAAQTLHITVIPTYQVMENTILSNIHLPVLGMDTNHQLIYVLPTQFTANHGVVNGVIVNSRFVGPFSYTPPNYSNSHFTGMDTFSYYVRDMTTGTDSSTTTVHFLVAPSAPGSIAQNFTGLENNVLSDIQLPTQGTSGNPGDTFTYNLITQAANGTVSLTSGGKFTYTPNNNFIGMDSFTYTVTDTSPDGKVSTTSSITVAHIDVKFVLSIAENEVLHNVVIPPSAFVIGNPGDSFSYVMEINTTHGSTVLNSNGTFSYTPNLNFTGTDSFTYHIIDTTESLTSGSLVFYIGVAPSTPGSAPVMFNWQAFGMQLPTQATSNNPNDTFLYTLTGGNVVNIPNSAQQIQDTQNGTITFVPTLGFFFYTPETFAGIGVNDPNYTFSGTDSFTYTVTDRSSDGTTSSTSAETTAYIKIAPLKPGFNDVNFSDAQNTLLSNAQLPTQQISNNPYNTFTYTLVNNAVAGTVVNLNSNTGTFSYMPNTNFIGIDSFTYTVTEHSEDGTTSNTSNVVTAKIAVAPSAPGHASQNEFIFPNEIVSDTLPAQDTSGNANVSFSFQLQVRAGDLALNGASSGGYNLQTPHGIVSLSPQGQFTYIPTADFFGTDSFSYTTTATLNGTSSTSAPTTVYIDVNYNLYLINTHGIGVITGSMVDAAIQGAGGSFGVNFAAGYDFIMEILHPETGNVYAIDENADVVRVISKSVPGNILATIPVGSSPTDIVFNTFTHHFYVFATDGTVSVIDPNSNTVIKTISGVSQAVNFSFTAQPYRMETNSMNGDTYVMSTIPVGGGSEPAVTVINSSNNIVTTLQNPDHVSSGFITDMVFNPDNNNLYVLYNKIINTQFGPQTASEIDIYNTLTNQFVSSIAANYDYGGNNNGGHPSLLYDPYNKLILISNGYSLFDAFSTTTNTSVLPGGFPLNGFQASSMVYDSHNHYVYVLSAGNHTLHIFDGSTGQMLSNTINIAGSTNPDLGTRLSFDAATNHIMVVSFLSGSTTAVTIIDDTTNTIVAVMPTTNATFGPVIGDMPADFQSHVNPTMEFSHVTNHAYDGSLMHDAQVPYQAYELNYQSDTTDSHLTITYDSQTEMGYVNDGQGHIDTISNFDVIYGASTSNTFVFLGFSSNSNPLFNNNVFGGPNGQNTADYSDLFVPVNDVLHIDLAAGLAYVTANGIGIGIPDKLLNFDHVIGSDSALYGEVFTVDSLTNVVEGSTNVSVNDVIDLSALANVVNLTASAENWTHIEGLKLGQATQLSINMADMTQLSPDNNQLTITAASGNSAVVNAAGGWTHTQGNTTTAMDVTSGTMHTYNIYTAGSETLLIDVNITNIHVSP